jgi:hypothetical protein
MTSTIEYRMSWIVTVLACWYVGWTGYVLGHRAPAFRQLFSGLGAELSWPTRAVLSLCTPAVVWPATIVTIAFLLVKERTVERGATRLLLSVIVFMMTACAAAVLTEALYQPMFRLIEQVR